MANIFPFDFQNDGGVAINDNKVATGNGCDISDNCKLTRSTG
jgi:hypothetical protein